jgi:adenylate kinase
VLLLELSDETARARLTKRAELEGRDDDQPEAIDRRLRNYHEKTKPVVEHYRATGKLVGVHAELSIEEVWAEIADALEQLQARA